MQVPAAIPDPIPDLTASTQVSAHASNPPSTSDGSAPAPTPVATLTPSLALRDRPVDVFFIVVFSAFTITSLISDLLPTLGVDISEPSSNFFVNSNWWYAHDTDPLFAHPPAWMRIVTGLSAFLYMPFYIVLVVSLIRGWNWIQLPSVIYATMIVAITGIIVFGVEFFGEEQWRTPNPVKFLAFNLPYVLIPLLLLVRMRKPYPFTRRF